MKRTYYFISLCILTLIFSCSKEDALTPTDTQYDYFTVSPDATDAESVLRRKFYEDHNIHLLFNDTLRHELQGTYADGTPYYFTELLDLPYNITSTLNDVQFTYIKNYEQKESSVKFVEKYILTHLGTSLRPYSIFLVDELNEEDYGYWDPIDFYIGRRCLALATCDIPETDEDEISEYALNILYNFIESQISYRDAEFTEFLSFGSEYYGEDFIDHNDVFKNGYEKPQHDDLYALGFISWNGRNKYFPYENNDLSAYLRALFYDDEEEFKAQYADYPVIIQKYNILKEVVKQKGYIF